MRAWLLSRGWKRYGAGFTDRTGERHVDLSGDYGYAWELNVFEESDDADGIARAMWSNTVVYGDTLAELAAALGRADRRAKVAA